jgi:hypothetical protein
LGRFPVAAALTRWDTRGVGFPGRRTLSIAAALALAAALLPAFAQAGSSVVSIGGGIPGRILGKLHTDGTLTVGQQETLRINKLPGKFRLAAYVEPPPPTTAGPTPCNDFEHFAFCVPQPLFRVPGTPRFHSSRKGRGTLTFVMPPGNEFISFSDPLQSHPVYFTNGQTVEIDVQTTLKHRNRRGDRVSVTFPVASDKAVVEVPPSS